MCPKIRDNLAHLGGEPLRLFPAEFRVAFKLRPELEPGKEQATRSGALKYLAVVRDILIPVKICQFFYIVKELLLFSRITYHPLKPLPAPPCFLPSVFDARGNPSENNAADGDICFQGGHREVTPCPRIKYIVKNNGVPKCLIDFCWIINHINDFSHDSDCLSPSVVIRHQPHADGDHKALDFRIVKFGLELRVPGIRGRKVLNRGINLKRQTDKLLAPRNIFELTRQFARFSPPLL